MLRDSLSKYRSLNHDRRQSPRHDNQVWINSVACEGEDQLNHGHPRDALNGSVLSHKPANLARWTEHFCTLLNRSPTPGSLVIDEAATAAIVDPSIRTDPPDAMDIAKAVGMLKNGKATRRHIQHPSADDQGCRTAISVGTEGAVHAGLELREDPRRLANGHHPATVQMQGLQDGILICPYPERSSHT